MRVTQNISAENSLYYLQKTMARMDSTQEKIASGVNVNRPSDDPVMTQLLLTINDNLSSADQFKSNISRSQTWFGIADAAISAMTKSISDLSSKISSVGDLISDEQERKNAISYLTATKKTLLDMGNTDIGGVYMFAGTKNQTPPFQQATATNGMTDGSTLIDVGSVDGLAEGMEVSGPGIQPGTKITVLDSLSNPPSITISKPVTGGNYPKNTPLSFYGGNAEDVNVEIIKGSTEAVNIPGNHLLASQDGPYGKVNILGALDRVIMELEKDPADPLYNKEQVIQTIYSGMKDLTKGTQQLIGATVELQARQVRFDAANTMHDTISNMYKRVLSTQQTADITKQAVFLNQQQTAYQATLSSTAKIMSMSLLDYM